MNALTTAGRRSAVIQIKQPSRRRCGRSPTALLGRPQVSFPSFALAVGSIPFVESSQVTRKNRCNRIFPPGGCGIKPSSSPTSSTMDWPNRFLLFLLCIALAAIFVPWFIPRARRGILIGYAAALVATICWVSYEDHLHSIARPGDPLIRVDLLLIAPLIVFDWLSATASLVVTRLRSRSNRQGTEPLGHSPVP